MNFLAHCLIPDLALEQTHPDIIAGGFVADFLKGPVPEGLPAELALGIRLHRRIDAYSNQQPVIRRSCERFPPELRRFAPIFVDVIADHLLAGLWTRFHPRPLTDFTATAYAAIEPHVHRLPESGKRFFDYMNREDLLARYRDPGTLHRALESLAKRLNRPYLSLGLEQLVAQRRAALELDFLDYFPDLVRHAAGWLEQQDGCSDAGTPSAGRRLSAER